MVKAAACCLILLHGAMFFIKKPRFKLIYLYILDALFLGIMIISGSGPAQALFFTAAAFAVNIFLCAPEAAAPEFKFGKDEFLLCVFGAATIAYGAFFAAKNPGEFLPDTQGQWPVTALFMLLSAVFTFVYFISRQEKGAAHE